MARKKKVEEVAEETPVVEEAPEEVVVEAEEAPVVYTVTLKGSIGSQFHGSVNGANFV